MIHGGIGPPRPHRESAAVHLAGPVSGPAARVLRGSRPPRPIAPAEQC